MARTVVVFAYVLFISFLLGSIHCSSVFTVLFNILIRSLYYTSSVVSLVVSRPPLHAFHLNMLEHLFILGVPISCNRKPGSVLINKNAIGAGADVPKRGRGAFSSFLSPRTWRYSFYYLLDWWQYTHMNLFSWLPDSVCGALVFQSHPAALLIGQWWIWS